MRLFLLVLAIRLAFTTAFAPPPVTRVPSRSSESRLRVVEASDIDSNRIAFFTWFFGASGGAGIARSSFPRMYNNVKTIQGLKGVGPSEGGETVGVSPLCGYPEDLSVADLQKIVQNCNIENIVEKYPVEGNFLSEKGYITYKAFEQYGQAIKANPLALRAVFDTFNTSTDVCDPNVAQALIDGYKGDISSFPGKLLKSKLIGFSSIFTLLFLLGLADVVAFGHAKGGWFPDWPGMDNMPWSLFDAETGLKAIPNYWLSDDA